jgi:hypothetical protein
VAITFSEPLEPNRASDPNNFQLRVPGRDRQFKSADDLLLTIQNMRYDESARAVVLTLTGRLPKRLPVMLAVVGRPTTGITDLSGHYLDGNRDGTPGDDFETIFAFQRKRR